jgi:hypothetical protein
MDFAPRPAPQTNFTDYADICARDAKSQDCKISCKNRAMDLMIIISAQLTVNREDRNAISPEKQSLISISSDPVKYFSSPLNNPGEYLTQVNRLRRCR